MKELISMTDFVTWVDEERVATKGHYDIIVRYKNFLKRKLEPYMLISSNKECLFICKADYHSNIIWFDFQNDLTIRYTKYYNRFSIGGKNVETIEDLIPYKLKLTKQALKKLEI